MTSRDQTDDMGRRKIRSGDVVMYVDRNGVCKPRLGVVLDMKPAGVKEGFVKVEWMSVKGKSVHFPPLARLVLAEQVLMEGWSYDPDKHDSHAGE